MKELDINSAFMFPFNRWKGMLNVLWFFLPIIGWFALYGYGIRIIKGFLKDKFKELPSFKFGDDLVFGFWMFLKAIPFIAAYVIAFGILGFITSFIGTDWITSLLDVFVQMFVIPILAINFFKKETIDSFFEFKILKYVFSNFGEYIMVLLKSFALALIYILMIIILVGFPALTFTQNIFMADFYRRRVKR